MDLAAIESAFRSVPGVIDVAVLDVARPIDASHGSAGVHRVLLVAHVSARADVTAESLRSELATRLIGPAIPSRIVLHDGPLPQLPSGKLDVKALRVS